MFDLKSYVPNQSGSHNIDAGTSCVIGVSAGTVLPNMDIGNAVVNSLTSNAVSMSGHYKYDTLFGKGEGDFNLTLNFNEDGGAWGEFNGTSTQGQYNIAKPGQALLITLSGLGQFTWERQEDKLTQKAKVWLKNLNIGGHTVDVYLYNSNYK